MTRDATPFALAALSLFGSNAVVASNEHVEDASLPMPSANLVGGTPTSPTRYPYMASIIVREQDEMNHLTCGGMLVAPDMVMTASHCPAPLEGVEIGRFNIDPEDANAGESVGRTFERFVIESEIRHPDYCPSSEAEERGCVKRENDFMLIKLFGQSTEPYLRINTDANVPSFTGEPLTVLGWGMQDVDVVELSDQLREIEVNYIPNDACRRVRGNYDGNSITYEDRITDRMLCAADIHQTDDSCYGDSGGPAIRTGDGIEDDLLVGIVSYGFGCAEPGLPGIYSRVSAVADTWIKSVVCGLSSAPPEYFGCAVEQTTKPNMITLTVLIRFDDEPSDTGWLLKDESGTIYEYSPIGQYGEEYEGQEISIYVDIDAGQTGKKFIFSLLDWSLDGLGGGNDGYFQAYLDGDFVAEILGDFDGPAKSTEFFVEAPPTPAPTPVPTALTSAPTSKPTSQPVVQSMAPENGSILPEQGALGPTGSSPRDDMPVQQVSESSSGYCIGRFSWMGFWPAPAVAIAAAILNEL